MLRATWTAGSLRFWIFVGMALSIAPLVASAVVVYVMLNRGVITEFQDVAARQRDQIVPIQHLQLDLWEAAARIELYLDDGAQADAAAYRALRGRIEGGFVRVLQALPGERELQDVTKRARDEWTEMDHAANSILARHFAPGDLTGIDLAKQINSSTAGAVDKLGAVSDGIRTAVDQDHSRAQRTYERSEWVTGIAATTSLLLMATGVFIIGRFLMGSIDRLVEGAARFASGDRDHRIEIRVPPELHKVAEEFNHMIGRIRDSEATLSDLARRDRLTGLLNRRAFDEALPAALALRRRRNEEVALLMLDLDHFKQINDTYGHAAGDAVLRATAAEMVSNLREDDKTFRIGGEEFAVLLRSADRAAAEKKAERLRASIAARRVTADGHDVAVTVSIGVAIPRDDIDAEGFLKAADAALYRAKTEGRNRISMASD